MLVFILLGLLLAKASGYALSPVRKAWALYPVFAVEAIHIVLVVTTFFEIYAFIPLARPLQVLSIMAMIPPILAYQLYIPALAGCGLTAVGSVLNRLVMQANGGCMPVLPTLSRLTGYYKPGLLGRGLDSVHILMTSATHLNFLGDYIDLGFVVLSPGDVCIHLFVTIILFYAIKAMNTNEQGG